MDARPPVKLTIAPMTVPDLPAVHEIERASFTTPWPPHAYQAELETNKLAQYIVLRADGRVIAFAGMWLMVDEAHITTFAVAPAWRRRRIGERLLIALLEVALRRGAHEATLEVRLSNLPARRLYEKYGFRPVGVRPRYYTDDNEDALIMTTPPLTGDAMRAKIAARRAEIAAEPPVEAPGADAPAGATERAGGTEPAGSAERAAAAERARGPESARSSERARGTESAGGSR